LSTQKRSKNQISSNTRESCSYETGSQHAGLPHHTSLPVERQRVSMRNGVEVSSRNFPSSLSFICIVSFPYRKFTANTVKANRFPVHIAPLFLVR